ncbi:AmpG family muropeptide MFS transporter [Funiculus sociatus GB2-A5]|uniref:AmpG family muropeptide MFS transporter n=2 Tax=Funiculus TaxID=2886342 RepID=A0ABV0JPB7_9CYAN|nr:AmpG family muropeptide MFS transporter [Trichocoleus sp. FACHB-832]MBD2064794.1 AmpG family muropeptide MFS transporter [Trichocoleus sp. FACHB-6]
MKETQSFLKVFQSRKMAALFFLGFSSGLPLFLTSKTLQAWMTVENVNLGAIGLFSLVGLPYSLKFIWSPLLDRFIPPFLGRRRGWLVLTQGALLVAIAAMALQKPSQALELLAINALLIAFFSATQDIAADAYRTDVLEKPEMGAGAAIFVLGYRVALLITGGLALILADKIPWPAVYLLMALLMAVGLVSAILAPEPIEREARPDSLSEAVSLPFIEFFQRNGQLHGLLILLFIILYKLGDALVNNMSTPFLLEKTGLNFSPAEVGAIQGGLGLLASIVGILAGGAILSKIGINRSLWVFGGLQAVSNLAYLILAQVGKNYQLLVLTINIENFCAGLGNAAFVAFLMSLCNQRFSATQYALLSSLMAVSRDILVAPAGRLAEVTGWPLFFLISIAAALPGLVLLPVFAPWNPRSIPDMSIPGLDEQDDEPY